MLEPGTERARDHRAAASMLLESGLLEAAIAELEAAVEVSRSAEDAEGEGAAEFLLASAYRETALPGAEEHLRLTRLHAERAEAAFRRAGNQAGLIDALILLALHFHAQGELLRLGFILDKLDQVHSGTASWLRIYLKAVTRMLSDRVESARLFHQALDSLDLLSQDAEGWREQCLRKLSFTESGGELSSLTETRSEHKKWGTLFREAMQLTLSGSTDQEIEARFDQAIDAAESMRVRIQSEAKQRELSHAMDPMYSAKAALADRGGRHAEALDAINLNTSRSLLSRAALRELWARSPRQAWKQLEESNDLLEECLVRYQQNGTRGHWQQLQLALHRRRQASHEVQEELVRIVQPPHQGFLPSKSTDVQASLGVGDAVVVFQPHGEIYVLRSGAAFKVATFDTRETSDACAQYRELVISPWLSENDEELRRVATQISMACIQPLESSLEDVSRLFLVPSGPLWGVPLAALGPTPLTEIHDVGIVPNLSIAEWLLRQSRPVRRVEKFIGVGNPDQTLPAAEEEVQRASEFFEDPAVFIGESVDFAETLTHFMDADVIHLACHAVNFPEYPELSYLHIAGRSDAPIPLFVDEVIRIPMSPRLVVLSACHAGTSVAVEGNEYVGFPGVFLVADARTVIAPLWAIPDTSTVALMDAFYQEAQYLSASQALRKAQEHVRSDPATAHPWYWQGMEVFGLP